MPDKISKKINPTTLARINRFTVSMPINVNIKEVYPDFSDDLTTINIFKPKIPGLSTPSVRLPTRGRNIAISGNMTKISPVPFNFTIDEHYLSWSIYYNWMLLHKNHTDGTGFQYRGENGIREDNRPLNLVDALNISPYNDIVISGYDGFNQLVLECTLVGAFPIELSDLDFDQQDGSDQIHTGSVTLDFDHHIVRFPKLEELIPNQFS